MKKVLLNVVALSLFALSTLTQAKGGGSTGGGDPLAQEFVKSGAIRSNSTKGSPWASPQDTPWNTREFHLRDPSQNSLQFYRAL